MTDQERRLDNALDKIMLSLSTFVSEMEREKASQRIYDAMFAKPRCYTSQATKCSATITGLWQRNKHRWHSSPSARRQTDQRRTVEGGDAGSRNVCVRVLTRRNCQSAERGQNTASPWRDSRVVSDCYSGHPPTRAVPRGGALEQNAGDSARWDQKAAEAS